MSLSNHCLPKRNGSAGFLRNQRGSISVMAAATIVPLIVAAGTAIDMARANRTLGHMQKSVDSAALAAAATRLPVKTADGQPLTGDEAKIDVAKKMVAANLPEKIKASADDPEVDITGTVVTVDLEAEMATSFMNLVGIETMSLSVSAAADYSVVGHACIIALGANGSGIEVGGNVDLQAEDCWLHSNKVGPKSVDIVGTAVVNAAGTRAFGLTSVTNNATVPPPENLHSNSYWIEDPLTSWVHPVAAASCDHNKFSKKTSGNEKEIVLSPGHYCGGLHLSGYDEVIIEEGLYYISGGDLTINSKANVSGAGVGFYLASDVTSATINGASNVTLSAYNDAGYSPLDGKLFAMEATDPDEHDPISVKINGGTGLDLTGTIYVPTGDLTISGYSSTVSMAAQIIAHSVTLTGVSHLSFELEVDEDGNPIGPEFVTVVKLIK